jgi:hypothetical protein
MMQMFTRRPRNLALLTISVIAFLALLVFLWDAYDLSGVKSMEASESQTSSAGSGAYPDAIVVLSAGDVENTMADGFLESISGLNPAPIYVFTDHPECVDTSKYDASKYPVYPTQIEVEFFELLSKKKSTIYLKRYKTTLFRYLPETVKTVLYIDRDIRFTESFRDWRPPMFGDGSIPDDCNIVFAGESRSFDKDAYNSGVAIMDRDISAECLHDWEDMITTGKYQMDQDAMGHTTTCNTCTFSKDAVLYVKSVSNYLTTISNYLTSSKPTQPMIHYTTSSHKKKSVVQDKCRERKEESIFGFLDEHCIYATFGDSMGFFLQFEDKTCLAGSPNPSPNPATGATANANATATSAQRVRMRVRRR